jgi:hypothetical protein
MVNEELIDLCRTLVAAIQESNTFDVRQLRRLILHVVPQLLVEIDILGGMLESLRLPEPAVPVPEPVKQRLEQAAKVAVASRPKSKRPLKKKKRGRR